MVHDPANLPALTALRDSLDELRARFNQKSQRPRLLVLTSPT